MSEQAIFFSNTSQLTSILLLLKKTPTVSKIGISKVRRPYVDKTRFKKNVVGTHVIMFHTTDITSLPFQENDVIEIGENKWGILKRLQSLNKKWNLVDDKWENNGKSVLFNEMTKHLEIARENDFDTTFEIPADEFFGGVTYLLKTLPSIEHNELQTRITNWAKTFLSRCIQAEPVFVINCNEDECPLICNDCGNETDKLFVSPEDEGKTDDNVSVNSAL